MSVLDTESTSFSVLASMKGRITSIEYWIEGMPTWGRIWSDPNYPFPPNYSNRPGIMDEEIYLAVRWSNIGGVDLIGHSDITVTSPSGVVYTPAATAGQDTRKSPGTGTAVSFSPIMLNESGSWKIDTVLAGSTALSRALMVLDQETVTFGIPLMPKILEIARIVVPGIIGIGLIAYSRI